MEEAEPDPDSLFDPDCGFGSVFGSGYAPPPPFVSLAPLTQAPSPAARRLSTCLAKPSRPVRRSAPKLAYVSLQGRLVNAEEATSAREIGGLGREEAVAWELFSPIQRVILVAVIGVAVAESKKNRMISQLRDSVMLRDQILSSMQQKLDNLCEHVNNAKGGSGNGAEVVLAKTAGFSFNSTFEPNGIEFVDCGCWLCDRHHKQLNGLVNDGVADVSNSNDMLLPKTNFKEEAEPEERRMSDLSDWASSVTSSAEIQMNNFAIEQDIYNLRRDCEEKDATIKELTGVLQSCDAVASKRIAELEDAIRRKNMIITKLRKDMVILEQKVVHLTRQRRPSFQTDASPRKYPLMADNLLYDMDSSTSPSSSDSDNSPGSGLQAPVTRMLETPIERSSTSTTRNHDLASEETSSFMVKPIHEQTKSRSVSPLTERSTNTKSGKISSAREKLQRSSAELDTKRNRKQSNAAGSKHVVVRRRWS